MIPPMPNALSSPAARRPELTVDLAAARLLPPLPSAWLAGRDLDLLEPLRFLGPLGPGGLPAFPAPSASSAGSGRGELAEALAVANRAYGNPNADRLAARLA